MLTSCGLDVPKDFIVKSSFDKPHPKRPRNLEKVLGSQFSIKRENDTISFKVNFNKISKVNVITETNTNDTIFYGMVAKYKKLYYFNQQFNDSTFWIHAVRIRKGYIQGLQTEWGQMKAWDVEIDSLFSIQNEDKNPLSSIVISYNPELERIRLTPKRKLIRAFYESIIDSMPQEHFVKDI